MSDPFESSKTSLEWGKKHVADLEQRIGAFIKTDPYVNCVYYDSERREQLQTFKFDDVLPKDFATLTADAVINFRKALDHACFALAVASGVTKPKNTHFPFGRDVSDFKGKFKSKSQDIPDEIRPLFCEFKPYKGGNDLLWALNRICNTEKHEMLSPCKISCRTNRVVSETASDSSGLDIGVFIGGKNEVIHTIVKTDTGTKYQGQLSFTITFGEIEIVRRKPVITVLNQFAAIVESILLAIEAEAKRLWPDRF